MEWDRILFFNSSLVKGRNLTEHINLHQDRLSPIVDSGISEGVIYTSSDLLRDSHGWEYDEDRVLLNRDENVIGTDSRKKVLASDNNLYGCVTRLISHFPQADTLGSGIFIAPTWVLTAGHNVFSPKYGGYCDDLEIWNEVVGSHDSVVLDIKVAFIPKLFILNGSKDYDLALIKVVAETPINQPFCSLASIEISELAEGKKTCEIVGFPADKGGDSLWSGKGEINKATALRRIFYNVDTEGGQSGAPIFNLEEISPKIIGIHVQGGFTRNTGVLLDMEVVSSINSIINSN